MLIKHTMWLQILLVCTSQITHTLSLTDQFQQKGYVEFYDQHHGTAAYDELYAQFDQFITFLQTHTNWVQKLYIAKERFIRSKQRNYYSTDFFGLYDESTKEDRRQIAFYYSIHFYEFLCTYYPELISIPEITEFLECCRTIQEPYGSIFTQVVTDLGIPTIFSSEFGEQPPILLKVIKYLPSYYATKPHYDGTALTLLLDSTDNDSLLLALYQSSLTPNDFSAPIRQFIRSLHQSSILLIPGTLLAEFSINPTPHIVTGSGHTRYATIAFAMRPNHIAAPHEFFPLASFKH